MRTPAADTVLRIALAAMAVDTRSALTPEQRAWIGERLRTLQALTAREVAKLQGPLLAWVRTWMPECEHCLAKQFEEVEAHVLA